MSDQILSGDRVLVRDPNFFQSHVAGKVRNREGVVRFIRSDNAYIVDFPAKGRRRAFTHHFYRRDLMRAP